MDGNHHNGRDFLFVKNARMDGITKELHYRSPTEFPHLPVAGVVSLQAEDDPRHVAGTCAQSSTATIMMRDRFSKSKASGSRRTS
jgi:hypothetical protein